MAEDDSNLMILGDTDMRDLLHALDQSDMEELQHHLAEALHTYSTGANNESACASNQPKRSVVHPAPGVSTFFMPARTQTSTGVKIVTLSESNTPLTQAGSSRSSLSQVLSNKSSNSNPSSPKLRASSPARSSQSSATTSLANLSLSHTNSSTGSSTPPSSISSASTKVPRTSSPSRSSVSTASTISSPQSLMSKQVHFTSDNLPAHGPIPDPALTSPTGSLTLLQPSGRPYALINAKTLTAFRTALATSLLLRRRSTVHTLTVFAAGAQAYWHIRLALLLRPNEIHHVNIITRTFFRATHLIKHIYKTASTHPDPTGWPDPKNNPSWLHGIKFGILTPDYQDYTRLLREQVRAADVIFTCTPSTTPLFPPELLTSTEGRKKGRLIAAIGSYRPHMQELHPDVLRDAVKGQSEKNAKGHHHHLHRHAERGGVVVCDTLDGVLKESGEVRGAELTGEQLVEVGELVMLRRAMHKEKEEKKQKQSSGSSSKDGESLSTTNSGGSEEVSDGGLVRWLRDGNVVYKSVGLGLLDVTVGEQLVKIAAKRNIGTLIEGF